MREVLVYHFSNLFKKCSWSLWLSEILLRSSTHLIVKIKGLLKARQGYSAVSSPLGQLETVCGGGWQSGASTAPAKRALTCAVLINVNVMLYVTEQCLL